MESLEPQIAEWRTYVERRPAQRPRRRRARGSSSPADRRPERGRARGDEAFLVAVKRMGDVDVLSREFAREHSGRLWKQLAVSGDDEPARAAGGWLEPLFFAVAAGVAIQIASLVAGLPRRGAELVLPERQSVRVAVPRRVLRLATGARRARLAAVGGAVRARCARDQPLSVGRGLGTEHARRAPSARRALVRRRAPVHGRHAAIARAAHGLRPLHRRVVHLLRADRARRRRADGADRGDPGARGRRRRADHRVGAPVRRGRCRDRRRVARRVEATRRGEHGAGARR